MLRVIALILVFYFIFRIVGRLLMPILGQRKPNPSQGGNAPPDGRREGEVRVEYTDPEKAKKKKSDTGEGEYVDFEELE